MKKISGLIVLSAGILWGMIGIFIRTLSSAGLSSLQIVFMRVVFGAFLLCVAALVRDYRMLKIRWKDCWCFLGTGIAGFAFFNYCYFSTIQYASLSVAAVLLYTAPSFVILFSTVLFQEKITFRKICALIFAFSGCMCATGLFAGETVLNAKGLLTGLGSGLGYALVTVFTRYALKRGCHSLTIVIYTLTFASLGSCFLIDVRPVFQYVFSDREHFLFCMLFVLVSTILPNLFYTYGLSGMENGRATIIVSVEPVAATVAGAVVFGEKLGTDGFIGILLMLISLIIINVQMGKTFQSAVKNKYSL